jgi:ectoine hydroxylase-related dioxygenase (phytanoyl-CoA dioxygenase family)
MKADEYLHMYLEEENHWWYSGMRGIVRSLFPEFSTGEAPRVLDAGCLVSSLSSISIDPGEQAQPIHADDQLLPLPKPHVPLVCNTMWALTDFTEENGATRVIPGSHLRDRSPVFGKPYDSVPAEMPRGSVLVWHGSLWHGGGANRTDEPRLGVVVHYAASWLRPVENHVLVVPPERARDLPPRLQELLGYNIHPPFTGYVDGRHPRKLLDA